MGAEKRMRGAIRNTVNKDIVLIPEMKNVCIHSRKLFLPEKTMRF